MRIAPIHTAVSLAVAASLIAIPAAPRSVRAQVTLAGEPVVAASPRMAGIYRVALSSRETTAQRMHLIVRLEATGYTCVLLSGEQEMPVTDLRLEGDVIRGTAATNLGKADVVLAIGEDTIAGTLTVGRTKLTISGERVG